jgi:diguanylate cyclase (GGDEF)-like protein/PAS domain S-box-containing protein
VDGAPEVAVFDALPDLVIAFDDSLTLKYVNPFARRLLEHEDTVLADQTVIEFLHPDDLGRAAEVAGLITTDSLQTEITPALYRLRTRTGRWVTVELNGTPRIESGPFAGLIVVCGRYSLDYQIRDRILEMLTAGESADDVVAVIPEYGLWRHHADQYAVIYTDDAGERVRLGSAGALDLLDRFDDADTPWNSALREQRELLQPWDQLDPALHEAALGHGLWGCMVLPVFDQLHQTTAIVIGWSSRKDQDPGGHRYALEQMARSLDVVMQWRSQVSQLEHAARFDALSGLANRAEFFRRFRSELDRAAVEATSTAVLYVDLDGFKAVNDTAGHASGDAVIVGAAERLSAAVRRSDVVARLGGDEFAVLCPGVADAEEVTRLADRIIHDLAAPFGHAGGGATVVGASVGIAIGAPGATDPDALLAEADAALYAAKASGKGAWVLAGDAASSAGRAG